MREDGSAGRSTAAPSRTNPQVLFAAHERGQSLRWSENRHVVARGDQSAAVCVCVSADVFVASRFGENSTRLRVRVGIRLRPCSPLQRISSGHVLMQLLKSASFRSSRVKEDQVPSFLSQTSRAVDRLPLHFPEINVDEVIGKLPYQLVMQKKNHSERRSSLNIAVDRQQERSTQVDACALALPQRKSVQSSVC